MKEQKVAMACMYYPTTIVAVDDSPSVLQNIEFTLGRIFSCKTFLIPQEALNYIQKNIEQNSALAEIVNIDEESGNYTYDSERLPLGYNISKIYENVYKKDRFSDVSLVIVDYAMPNMNGEEFCRKLREDLGEAVKIIMLTGEANDPKAIELFNAGVIDRFLRKSQEGVDEALINCILEMRELYFKNTTSQIYKAISSDKTSALGDPVFSKLFNKVREDISAVSYYLIEISGSFIFFDSAGKPTWLIIKTLEDLEEIAEQIEPHISEELIDSIAQGEVVPYFGAAYIDCYSDEKKLKKSLHKAQKLTGKQVYCYALLDELPEFALERGKITSFNEYMISCD